VIVGVIPSLVSVLVNSDVVKPDVMLVDSDPLSVPLSVPLSLLAVVVTVLFCVGGAVMMTLVSVAVLEPEPVTGVGVCSGPPGFVKLSSPALKLEQTARPAL
jgi:hypothetical protein